MQKKKKKQKKASFKENIENVIELTIDGEYKILKPMFVWFASSVTLL